MSSPVPDDRRDPGSESDPIAPAIHDFLARYVRGDAPQIEEYIQSHPELAPQLRNAHSTVQALQQLDPSTADWARSSKKKTESQADGLPDIPDYRISREIGRGGMGVVYEAEQKSLSRRVALKVLPAQNRNDPVSIERFRQEARAAAALHHSNIVPVFEVGSTAEHNYYAMQYIIGDGLDRIIEALRQIRAGDPQPEQQPESFEVATAVATRIMSNPATDETVVRSTNAQPETDNLAGATTGKPTTSTTASMSALTSQDSGFFRNTARIGVEVASALEHAHRNGVIHRDIKPANILLDTNGHPWVADFGLAKTEDANLTRTGDVLGTLRYMSPERFSGPCGTPGDIYSLGATLYEMLTLEPIYTARDQLALINQIKSESPQPMRSINASIPPDLETIVAKAIDRDPARRYPTARLLADDLQRFLDGRPILARRVGPMEKVWLWSRNNKLVASLLVSLAVGLVAIAIIMSIAASVYRNMALRQESIATKEAKATRRANRQARKAALEADIATSINEFFRLDILNEADAQSNARDIGLREALIRASERIGDRFRDKPIVEGEIRRTIGKALFSLAQFEKAIGELEKSRALLEDALGPDDPKTMATVAELGRCYRDWEKPELGEPYTRRYLKYATKTFGPDDPRTMQAMHMLGMVLDELDREDEAEPVLLKVLEWRRANWGTSNTDTIRSIAVLGSLYLYSDQLAKAEPLIVEAVELAEKHVGREDFLTMVSRSNLSQLYLSQKRYEKAEPLLQENLQMAAELLGENHQGVVITLGKLASLYANTNRLAKAIEHKQIQIQKSAITFGPDSEFTIGLKRHLAAFHSSNAQPELARKLTLEALQHATDSLGEESWPVHECKIQLADLDSQDGRLDSAVALLEQSFHAARKMFGEQHRRAIQVLDKLGSVLYLSGRFEEARDAKQTVLTAIGQRPDAELEYRLDVQRVLSLCHLALEDYEQALPLIQSGLDDLRQAPELAEQEARYRISLALCFNGQQEFAKGLAAAEKAAAFAWREDQQRRRHRISAIQGRSLTGLKRYDEAEKHLLEAHAGLRESDSARHRAETVRWLTDLYEQSNQPDKAARWSVGEGR